MPLIGGVFNPPPPSQHGRVADWFAQLNNKMGGDLKKIQNVGRYMVEIWKAVGMDMSRVEFLYASGARACAHVCVCAAVCALVPTDMHAEPVRARVWDVPRWTRWILPSRTAADRGDQQASR